MSITHRVGCFFLLIGGLVMIIFLASDMNREPQLNALWVSLPLLGIGYYFWQKGHPKAKPSGRFRLLNRVRSREKGTPDEKKRGS